MQAKEIFTKVFVYFISQHSLKNVFQVVIELDMIGSGYAWFAGTKVSSKFKLRPVLSLVSHHFQDSDGDLNAGCCKEIEAFLKPF